MKSWKENNMIMREKKIEPTPSGYIPSREDRNTLRNNARDLGELLLDLCDIATSRSNENFDETKQIFEEVLSMFYNMLDYVRR